MEDFKGVIDMSKRALASSKKRKAVEVLNEKQGPNIWAVDTIFKRNHYILSSNLHSPVLKIHCRYARVGQI